MSSKQIRLQISLKIVRDQQLDLAVDQAVNSRLLVWQQKMHGSNRCCGKLAEVAGWLITSTSAEILSDALFPLGPVNSV